ncbi:DUF599 domain-containing protein [Aliiroseovarius sp. M344]|uniref:DUF599 domain-containing protein n=1 Tax=Aliiroseovarius sp. M344 TaxID=2867010 RepID=UPI0021ADA5C5|nr:DUF599 domain-containing protein [Aliiroseovarius sp. M344]UWQ13626.1 DUF599 domain-containing protein [Aliiroseovarius sp. M344]
MSLTERLSLFSLLDGVAVCLIILGWAMIGWLIENASSAKPAVSGIVAQYRRDWMEQFVTREPRIFDSAILSTLRQGASFFASASMIAIGGGMALLGNTERLRGVAQDLTLSSAPELVWEVKILLVVLFLANAFLKFVWSHRLFGYCAVVMASVPNDPSDPTALPRARKAGEINITAARSFNRGLRSVYFALGSLAWLLGPVSLIVATFLTVSVLWRREFASHSRTVLLRSDSD